MELTSFSTSASLQRSCTLSTQTWSRQTTLKPFIGRRRHFLLILAVLPRRDQASIRSNRLRLRRSLTETTFKESYLQVQLHKIHLIVTTSEPLLHLPRIQYSSTPPTWLEEVMLTRVLQGNYTPALQEVTSTASPFKIESKLAQVSKELGYLRPTSSSSNRKQLLSSNRSSRRSSRSTRTLRVP